MKHTEHNDVCDWTAVTSDKPNPDSFVGFAIESLGKGTLHGLRHPSNESSNGWYIWFGEYSENEDFFSPVSVKDIGNYLDSKVMEYLDLPAGYRFTVEKNKFEDVWFDEGLLI